LIRSCLPAFFITWLFEWLTFFYVLRIDDQWFYNWQSNWEMIRKGLVISLTVGLSMGFEIGLALYLYRRWHGSRLAA